MPGLHFPPSRQRFSSPQPLLLASVLYCSSVRGAAAKPISHPGTSPFSATPSPS
ncbi:Uncharacterized protein TPAR_05005 [Tolypocladium paradoxum]|uniref:Uncharacterized protein n=1 Tax=Tolypocladium paradoxum TaxID=94208 RepID=A0A2S4KX99_9HYPO|nr:Uncharacterized protein TPAR_05005 [Tolypocladium paradoxum]